MNIFFKAVSEGRPEAALLSLFNMAESRLAFIKYVLSEEDEEFHPSCHTLALSIWNNEKMYWTGYNSSRIDNPNLALYSDVFNAKLQEYQRLWQNYKDFLSSPLTVANFHYFSRRDAVDMALDYEGDWKEHLRHRRLAKMIRISGRAFRAGRKICNDDEE